MAFSPASAVTSAPTLFARAKDFVALTKPGITMMVVFTTAGGMWFAPGAVHLGVMLATLVTVALVVGAANSLNCYLERDVDRLMTRTANRPLPAGRLHPTPALIFGVALSVVAIALLALATNPLTAALGALALVLYAFVYTPMKKRSWVALLVGAVPGAMPPLMGWTASTARLDAPALVLFGILFLWQLPHFVAIATFRREEYARAGLKVLPEEMGDRSARWLSIGWALLLIGMSLLLVPFGAAGWLYGAAALVAGGHYLAATMRSGADPIAWGRRVFRASLLYLPVLFIALMLDAGR